MSQAAQTHAVVAALRRHARVLASTALVASLGALGTSAGTGWLEERVGRELRERVARAGLSMQVRRVTVSPFGWISLQGVTVRRGDGTMALSVSSAVASWRLVDLLRGRRLPESLHVLRPAADIRLADGRPDELRRWWRAMRGGALGPDRPPVLKTPLQIAAERRALLGRLPERMDIIGAVVRLDLRGRYADLVPGGVLVHDIDLRWRRGQGGRVSGVIDRPKPGRLLGDVLQRPGGHLDASARFDPPLLLPLPRAARERTGADRLRVAGLAWSDAGGAEVTALTLLRGELPLLSVEAAGGELQPELSAWARGVELHVGAEGPWGDRAGALLQRWLGPAAQGAAPGVLRVARVNLGSRRGLGRLRRHTLKVEDVEGRLPARLGWVRIEGLRASVTQRGRAPVRLADLHLQVQAPRLDLHLPRPEHAAGVGLASLARFAASMALESTRTLSSSGEEAPSLQPGWQRPGTLSRAERRRIRRRRSREELRAERMARRRKRQERLSRRRREGAYTRRFVAPLRGLWEACAAAGPGVSAALRRLLAEGPHATVQGAALVLHGAGHPGAVSALWRGRLRLRPSGRDGPGRLRVDFSPGDARRLYGRVTASVLADDSGAAGPVRVHAQGGALARVLRGLWPHLGIGSAPELALDVTVALGDGRVPLSLEGSVRSRGVGLSWERFAPVPITDIPLSATFAFRATRRPRLLRLDVRELRVGRALLSGRLIARALGRQPQVDVRVEMPRQDCALAAASIPPALLPTIGAIKAHGEIAWWVQLHVDLAHPYFSELDLGLDDKGCEVESFGKIDVEEIARPFSRRVNEDGFLLDRVRIGPTSGSWTPLSQMPRWVPYAMMTTEDGSFYSHRGLNLFLLNRAIRLDLHYGRFVYGGSTLTQQLVKNLYMTRSKFLGRKLEELLIVWQMERKVPKSRILEVYTNAVEFGPGVYGVTRGARHYFGKSPSRLTPLEAAWLGSLKPCPGCADGQFRSRRYGLWYQKRLLEILTRMHYYGVISQAQYDREMNTVPRFVGWPADKLAQRFSHPVPPRKVNPVDLGRRAADEDPEKLQAEAAERREKMRLRIVAREERLRRLRELRLERREEARRRAELARLKARGQEHGARAVELARQRREARARLERLERRRRLARAAERRRQAEREYMERQRRAIEAERRKRLGLPAGGSQGVASDRSARGRAAARKRGGRRPRVSRRRRGRAARSTRGRSHRKRRMHRKRRPRHTK